jgi:hypothetical protein
MALTPTLFYRGAAATSSTTLYTVPAATTAVLTDIVISNTSSNQQYVTITVDTVNILPSVPVSGNTVVTIQPKTVIPTGDIVAGFASSADISFHISGVELT